MCAEPRRGLGPPAGCQVCVWLLATLLDTHGYTGMQVSDHPATVAHMATGSYRSARTPVWDRADG